MKRPNEILNKVVIELIEFAKDLGRVMSGIAFTPYGQLRLVEYPRSQYYYKISKFQKHGLIKKVRKGQQSNYVLTPKAKQLALAPTTKHDRSDGLSTIVIFDISEDKHNARNMLRRYLIRNGYTQIQKSVFISPFKVSDDMQRFIKEIDVEGCVSFISGKIDRYWKQFV